MSITMEQLRSCRTLMREMEAIEQEMVFLGGARRKYSMDIVLRGSGGGYGEQNAREWQQYEYLEGMYKRKLLEYARIVFIIEQAIDALPPEQREIMRLRYIIRLHWKEIAVKVDYSERRCFDYHTAALTALGIEADETIEEDDEENDTD